MHSHARAEHELVKELNYSQIYESKIGLQAEVTTTRREGEFLRKKRLNGYKAIALYAHRVCVRYLAVPVKFHCKTREPWDI